MMRRSNARRRNSAAGTKGTREDSAAGIAFDQSLEGCMKHAVNRRILGGAMYARQGRKSICGTPHKLTPDRVRSRLNARADDRCQHEIATLESAEGRPSASERKQR